MRFPSIGAVCVYLVYVDGNIAAAVATSTSSCGNIPTPSPTPLPAYHCNSQGTTVDQSYLARFVSSTGDITACFDSCLGDAKCISFAYDTNTATCLTFAQSVKDKTFTRSDSSGIFYYNRLGCFLPATCAPAPINYVANGDFEAAFPDESGNYHVDPWNLDIFADTVNVQKGRGSGHSSFSVSCIDYCDLTQQLPHNLIDGQFYVLSFDYMVPVKPGLKNATVTAGFTYTQTFIGEAALNKVSKTYTKAIIKFQYKEYTGRTTFSVHFANPGIKGFELLLDNIAIIDA